LKPGNLTKSKALSAIEKHWREKYFDIVFKWLNWD
jgi:hypothetical protein